MTRGWRSWPSVGGGVRRFHRDARLFLVTTFVAGAAISLYYIDFNLYLRALGFSNATIGVVSTIASIAGAAGAFPASAASDRYGRRAVIGAGMGLGLIALIGFLLTESLAPIVVCAAAWSVGMQAFLVVQSPFLAEHSEPEHRNSLFAVQFAIQSVTNVVAAVVGGLVATAIAGSLGMDPAGAGTYRVILVIMAGLLTASLASVVLLVDDRPRIANGRRLASAGEPAAFPPDPRRPRTIFGIVIRDRSRFVRLVLPGFLISLGAGQVLPFLNLFIQRKFGLDLQSLNAVFAFTSLGTMAAILAQPSLARRYGQITSVVIVQTASIPFLVVLGFSPVLWTVILAMAVRNSLMNAGNPIYNAFAMEQVSAAERATLSATTIVGWQIGWVVGGIYYAVLQALLGFEGGYAVNFVTIIVLYTIATALYWVWFGRLDSRGRLARSTA